MTRQEFDSAHALTVASHGEWYTAQAIGRINARTFEYVQGYGIDDYAIKSTVDYYRDLALEALIHDDNARATVAS